METDMKDTMKRLVLGIALLALPALADTPLVQALKVEQSMKDVIAALHDVNVDVQSFSQVPDAIRSITRIDSFLDGVYIGPVLFNGTSFGNTCFKNLPGAFDVYMPNLTTIASEIFYPAPGLLSFYGPKVTSVNNSSAFRDSTNLGIVDLPECTYVGNSAFYGCTSLTNINIPKVTSTGTYAFYNCNNLKEVNCLPLATVNDYAFYNCTSLTNIPSMRKSSATFNARCFYNCTSLDIKDDEWPNNINLSYGYLFSNCKNLKNVNPFLLKFTLLIADNSTDQGRYFEGCTGLTDLHSDNLVTLAAYGIFNNCTSVTNVDFPNVILFGYGSDGLTSGYLFGNMTNLKRVNLPKLQGINSQCTSGCAWNMFVNCINLEEIEFPSLQTIGNKNATSSSPTETGEPGNMFYNCYRLRSARFPVLQFLSMYTTSNSDQAMFYNCYDLEDVLMPSLKTIKKKAFYNGSYSPVFFNCTKLAEANFPSLEQIWRRSRRFFFNCPALKKVNMPKLVHMNNSGDNDTGTPNMTEMFYQCPYISDVTFGLKANALKNYAGFPGGAPTTCVFHCPADAPYNVDVMYLTNAWTVVTNGTFKLIDSIKGTGTLYINTGYTHNTNTLVEIDFALCPIELNQRSYEYMWGSNNGNNDNNSFGAYTAFNNNRMFVYVRNTDSARGPAMDAPSVETRYKMVCCTNRMEVYNSLGELAYSLTSPNAPNEGTCPIGIFDANRTTTKGGFTPYGGSFTTDMFTSGPVKNMKLFRFTIKEEGETVMDLVPALVGGTNTEQVACLVDLKNNFHPLFNIGTGRFEAGNITNDIATAYSLQE